MSAQFTKLKVLSYRQQLPVFPGPYETIAVDPASIGPFLVSPQRPGARLTGSSIRGQMIKLRIEIEKDGTTFWVGVAVPVGTTDFSRCYVYFYPDTLPNDNGYKTFTGWEGLEHNYLEQIGTQMASVKPMTLIIPYTTNASRVNDAKHNMFATQGLATLNDIMTAVQMEVSQDPLAKSAGQAVKPEPGSLKSIGVASFSSGLNHLNRFIDKFDGKQFIKEIIDFDGQNIGVKARPVRPGTHHHLTSPTVSGADNWWVTQNTHPLEAIMGSVQMNGTATKPRQLATPRGWIYIPPDAFRGVPIDRKVGDDTHDKIGRLMFAVMMSLSKLG